MCTEKKPVLVIRKLFGVERFIPVSNISYITASSKHTIECKLNDGEVIHVDTREHNLIANKQGELDSRKEHYHEFMFDSLISDLYGPVPNNNLIELGDYIMVCSHKYPKHKRFVVDSDGNIVATGLSVVSFDGERRNIVFTTQSVITNASDTVVTHHYDSESFDFKRFETDFADDALNLLRLSEYYINPVTV